MKHILTLFLGCVCTYTYVLAAIPANYYAGANGKTSDAALTALNGIIGNHTVISYSALEDYYEAIDFDSAGYLMDMYSTCKLTMSDANKSQKKVCDAWNKEHSIPQSWFGEKSPMKSDLFHVVPTDARVNNFRSNMPYGETSSTAYIDDNPKALGHIGTSNFSGFSGKVYEPDDQFKGDFARIYFYMVARYRSSNLSSSAGSDVFTSSPTNLTTYATNLFLKWHRQDPVSVKEIKRNEAVYKVQKNRNPFVDYPYLAEYIWGTKKGEKVDFTKMISSQDPSFIPGKSDGQLVSTDPTLYASADKVTFSGVLVGHSSSQTLTVRGANLTAAISLSLSGENAAAFQVTPTTISKTASTSDQTITVSYIPLQEGLHYATLTLSSTGAQSVNIPIEASCNATCSVIWMVDGDEYTLGEPTQEVAFGQKVTVLPTPPASCSKTSEQFVGWTQQTIMTPTDAVPYDLFSDTAQAPILTANTTFHAVFAHVEKKGGEAETISMDMKTSEGWTITKASKKSNYYVLVANSSVTSPIIDLSSLLSVTMIMRTYGGTQYNAVTLTAGSTTLGTLNAKNTTLNSFTWTRDTTVSYSGQSAITFTSSTCTSDAGPAFSEITIQCTGIRYEYSQYVTQCSATPTETLETTTRHPKKGIKMMRDGQLIIEYNGHVYNMLGMKIK